MLDPAQICIISGDFNLNFRTESGNLIINELLKMHFIQMIEEPTHTQGGIIDHLYIRGPAAYSDVRIESDLIAPFYTDHFGITITIYKKDKEFKHIQSTVPDYLLQQEDNDYDKGGSSKRRKSNTNNIGSKRKNSSSPAKTKRQHQQL